MSIEKSKNTISAESSLKINENLNAQRLMESIQSCSAKVGVVGMGYVGLPFAVEKAKSGFQAFGFDIDEKRTQLLNEGVSYISDVSSTELREVIGSERFRATTDLSLLKEMDVIVIAVPTPLTKQLVPDLSFVEGVSQSIAQYLRKGQLVSLESTTYPGTTEEVVLPILEKSGLKVEQDFYLAYSPERVDPGNRKFKTKNTTKVVGGVGPTSTALASVFYSKTIDQIVTVSSAKAAEFTKVYENTFRAVNIALVNEMAMLADRMELNIWEILDAAFTKPFGIQPFYPGPGVGGHCIPLDPHYLEWKAKEHQFNTRFINLAGEINRKMPEFVLEKMRRYFNQAGLVPSQSRVLVLGVAYKRDLDDWRESPALDVIRLLRREGCEVTYHDPFISKFTDHDLTMESVQLDDALLRAVDLVIITTPHTHVDYDQVVSIAPKVLDTRNATQGVKQNRDKIILL